MLQEQLKKEEIELKKLKGSSSENATKIQDMMKEIKMLKSEKNKFAKDNEKLQKENQQLTSSVSATATIKQQRQFEMDLKKARADLQKKEREYAQLKKRFDVQATKNAKNQEENEDSKIKDIIKLRKELDKEKQAKIALKIENERLAKKAKSQKRVSVISINDQIEKQEQVLARRNAEIRDQQAKLLVRQKELENMLRIQDSKEKHREKEMMRKDLERDQELDNEKKRLSYSEKQLAAERERLRRSQEELERKKKLLENAKKLRIPDDDVKRIYEGRQGREKQLSISRKHIEKEYYTAIEKFNIKYTDLERGMNKLREKQKRLNEIENKLKDVGDQIIKKPKGSSDIPDSDVVSKFIDAEDEFKKALEEFDDAILELHSKGKELKDLEERYALETLRKDEEIAELEDTIEKLRQQLELGEQHLDEFDSENKGLYRRAFNKDKNVNPETLGDEDLLKQEWAQVCVDRDELLHEYKSFVDERTKFDEVETKMNRLHDNVNQKNQELDTLRGQYQFLARFLQDPNLDPEKYRKELHAALKNARNILEREDLNISELLKNLDPHYHENNFTPNIKDLQKCHSGLMAKINQLNEEDSNMVNRESASLKYELESLMQDCRHHVSEINEDLSNCNAQSGILRNAFNQLEIGKGLTDVLGRENCVKEEEEITNLQGEIHGAERHLQQKNNILDDDDKATKKLIENLRELQFQLLNKQIKAREYELEKVKQSCSGFESKELPPIAVLTQLKDRLENLQNRINEDKSHLDGTNNEWQNVATALQEIGQSIDQTLPEIKKHKRRSKKKLINQLIKLNDQLDKMATDVKNSAEKLSEFRNTNIEPKQLSRMDTNSEYNLQRFLVDHYAKQFGNESVAIGLDNEKTTLMENKEANDLASPAINEVSKTLDESNQLLENIGDKLSINCDATTQQQSDAYGFLEQICKMKNGIIENLEKNLPLPLTVDDIEAEQLKNAKKQHQDEFSFEKTKELAGITPFDDTKAIQKQLEKVQRNLGIASDLHFSVVSNHLNNKLETTLIELGKLESAFNDLLNTKKSEPTGATTMKHLDITDFTTPLVQDLAADYDVNTDTDVIEETLSMVKEKIEQIRLIQNKLQMANELEHLKQLYSSFVDPNIPQPMIQGDSPSSHIMTAEKDDYTTEEAQHYAGLSKSDEPELIRDKIQELNRVLHLLRAQLFPLGFNHVYQGGLIFTPFPGDKLFNPLALPYNPSDIKDVGLDEKTLAGEFEDSIVSYDQLQLLNENENDKHKFVRELMKLELDYNKLLRECEDNETQNDLLRNEYLYYRRLFNDTLPTPELENERANLLMGESIFQSRRIGYEDMIEEKIVQRQAPEKEMTEMDALKELLRNKHAYDENKTLPEQIENLCDDKNKYKTDYEFVVKSGKDYGKLKNQMLKMQNDHTKEIEEKNFEIQNLKEKLEEARLNMNNDKPNLEKYDILTQLHENLKQLRDEAQQHDPSDKPAANTRHRLEEIRRPLTDLAHDLEYPELQQAVDQLGQGIDNIRDLEKTNTNEKGPLIDICQNLIDEIQNIINSQNTLGKVAYSNEPGANNSIFGQEMEMSNGPGIEPEEEKLISQESRITTKGALFVDEYPIIRAIRIDGSFLNKYPVCEIECRDEQPKRKIERKMKHFKWLWKMLLLKSELDKPVPDFPTEIPEALWPDGYLRRRKNELNLFLMQCYYTQWIRTSEPYIAFLSNDEEWKSKKKLVDQNVLDTIK